MTTTILVNTVIGISGLIGIALAILLVNLVGKENAKKLQTVVEAKKQLIKTAVLFVQQVYGHFTSEHKYNLAVEHIQKQFEKFGFKTDGNEIRGMIEEAVKVLKKEFGDSWTKAVDNSDDSK